MTNIKKPTNWYISNDANNIINQLDESKANMTAADTASLAVSIIISNEDTDHQNIALDKSKVHKGRYAEIPGIDSLGLAYSDVFKHADAEELWSNVEKAISAGIQIIGEKYFDEDTQLIEWDKIERDFN